MWVKNKVKGQKYRGVELWGPIIYLFLVYTSSDTLFPTDTVFPDVIRLDNYSIGPEFSDQTPNTDHFKFYKNKNLTILFIFLSLCLFPSSPLLSFYSLSFLSPFVDKNCMSLLSSVKEGGDYTGKEGIAWYVVGRLLSGGLGKSLGLIILAVYWVSS